MRLLALTFALFVSTLLTIDAYANTALRISPHRIHIKVKDRVSPVSIQNNTDTRKAYRISLETRYLSPEGASYLVSNTAPFSAAPYIRISPRRVILGAGERQTIRLQVRGRNIADGDYFAHLKFTEVKLPLSLAEIEKQKAENVGGGMKFEITQAVNIAIPLTLSRGKVNTTVKILSVEKSDFKQGTAKFLDAYFSRKGNGQGKGFLYGRFKSNKAVDGEIIPIIINRMPLNIYRNTDKYMARMPISNVNVPLEDGKFILTLHQSEGVNSPVLDSYVWDIP